jgi:Outer membrane protein beta-barrel domain
VKNRPGVAAALLLLATLAPVPLLAQTAEKPPRAAVLATLGAMWPTEAAVSELYNGAFMPVTIEADVRIYRWLFVFGGAQFYGKDGEVVFNLPPAPEERFPLRVSTASVRFGGGIAYPRRKWIVSAAAGLSYTHFEERWTTEDVPTVTGQTLGFVVQGGVDYRIFKRLWAVGRVEYGYTPMDETKQVVPTFDLSGFSVSGGVAVRF